MSESDLLKVPLFVKAKSPEALIRAMIANNIKHQTTFKYFAPVRDGGNWIAWYLGDATPLVRKAVNDGLERRDTRS